MAVARFKGAEDRGDGHFPVGRLPGSEPDAGDFYAVCQGIAVCQCFHHFKYLPCFEPASAGPTAVFSIIYLNVGEKSIGKGAAGKINSGKAVLSETPRDGKCPPGIPGGHKTGSSVPPVIFPKVVPGFPETRLLLCVAQEITAEEQHDVQQGEQDGKL